MWNEFQQFQWFSLEFSRCPALSAGNPLPQFDQGCPGSWRREQRKRVKRRMWVFVFCCCYFWLKIFLLLSFSDLLTIEQNRWVGIPGHDWSTPESQHQPIHASWQPRALQSTALCPPYGSPHHTPAWHRPVRRHCAMFKSENHQSHSRKTEYKDFYTHNSDNLKLKYHQDKDKHNSSVCNLNPSK